jgi:hypothetical protein
MSPASITLLLAASLFAAPPGEPDDPADAPTDALLAPPPTAHEPPFDESEQLVPQRPIWGPESRRPGPHWKRWAAPLMSALIPGAGQALNRQAGKATISFAGSVGLITGVVGLHLSRDPRQGAAPGVGESPGVYVTRLGAMSVLSSAAAQLYLAQIIDAYAVAAGIWPTPRKTYMIHVDATRMSTVGLEPGAPGYAIYDNFALSVMGQVVPKVAFGLSDMTVMIDGRRNQYTLQAGLRASWRFFERERWWFLLAGGVIMQGTGADNPRPPIEPDLPGGSGQQRFGAIPYVQLEGRWFFLDRFSLNFAPRVSVPLTDRDYRIGRIPRYATTFELGTGVGVYF